MGCCSRWCGLGALPVALFSTLMLSFIATYIIAVKEGHVSAEFPYISDTGADPPESCIFTLMVSLCAFLVFCIVFIRFKQVAEYYKMDVLKVLGLNAWSSYVGYLAAFGMLVVASFQEENVGIAHLVGALSTFGGGCIYTWLQCIMTRRIQNGLAGVQRSRLLYTRVVVAILCTLSLISTFGFMIVAHKEYHSVNVHGNGTMHWQKGDGGYGAHLASTASEWAMGLFFVAFFLTFCKEFQRINLDVAVRLRLREDFAFLPERQALNEAYSEDGREIHSDGMW